MTEPNTTGDLEMDEGDVEKMENELFMNYWPAGAEQVSTAAPSEAATDDQGRDTKAAKLGTGQKANNVARARWGRTKRAFGNAWDSSGAWDRSGNGDNKINAALKEEIKELKNSIFQIQRLALRHEDFLGALRPETTYVLFCRIGVPASVVPSLFKAQAAWREMKASDPASLDRPMRVSLLTCLST
ncbi:unnamed protein product [Symbiodinium sp. CCMP2592]|nr:unnamed protein product [Symbiodinium sp. CCMP2592]